MLLGRHHRDALQRVRAVSSNYEAVPCRVCGSEPLFGHEADDHLLRCPNGCSMGSGPTEDKAILDWNREQEGSAVP
jgi:hypothetical protein